MIETLYRRPLPDDAIAFSSPEGLQLFSEALASGGLGGYFPLAEQFHTQSEPSFCGLGSLVVALNALAIDPGRLWKGPWRWFSEDLLDCCVPLEEVRRRGLDLDEVACLARCNGADVEMHRAEVDNLELWRSTLKIAASGGMVVIASYDRSAMGQTGNGHASPIGGYHAARDLVLVMDVARFKYPPHWTSAARLWHAMQIVDPSTERPRGWIVLRRRQQGAGLGFSFSCEGQDLHELALRLSAVVDTLPATADLRELAGKLSPLAAHLLIREASTPAHRDALAHARAAVRSLAGFPLVVEAVGDTEAELVTILLLVVADRGALAAHLELSTMLAEASRDETLVSELRNLRAQLDALSAVSSERPPERADAEPPSAPMCRR